MKTSLTHPFIVHSVPASAGRIGLSLCPGQYKLNARNGPHDRDIDSDVSVIERWGASIVLTLIEQHEFKSLDVEALPQIVINHGMTWLWAPIRDGGVPEARTRRQFNTHLAMCLSALKRGERVFVHCQGGLGRAGMISAALLMLADDVPPQLAIDIIRGARSDRAIETLAQERWLHQREQTQ